MKLRMMYCMGLLVLLVSCQNDQLPPPSLYSYSNPTQFNDGIEVGGLNQVGMDEQLITSMMDELLNDPSHSYHSMLIFKDDKLVLEEYFGGFDLEIRDYELGQVPFQQFDESSLHFSASVTKSVTSLLYGIAIDKGIVPANLNTSLFTFFDDYQDLGNGKLDVTVHHMLSMTTGLEWSEDTDFVNPTNNLVEMWNAQDPVGYLLAKPLEISPGNVWNYNSGVSTILGEIVARSANKSLSEFAAEELFEPLGINDFEWVGHVENNDLALGGGGLYLSARSMVKLGRLVLNEGVWNGKQIVSAEWIRESTSPQFDLPPSFFESLHAEEYGYHWWVESYDNGKIQGFSARGWGLQFIIVVPALDLVVVLNGGHWNPQETAPVKFNYLIEEYIIPAVQD